MKRLFLLLFLLVTSCSTIHYQEGNASFSRTSFGSKLAISKLTVRVTPDGSRVFILEGYANDQAEALAKVAEAAAKGAASAVTGK